MLKLIHGLTLIFGFIVINPIISMGQTHKFEVGAIIGSNYSIPISEDVRFSWIKYLPGFNIGASFQYNLTSHVSFRSSIFSEQHFNKIFLYSDQVYLHPYNNEQTRYAIFQSNSATLSLSTRFLFGQKTKFFIDGGFHFSRYYGYKTTTITDNNGKIKEYYDSSNQKNSFRFVLSPGISIPLGNKIIMTYELSWAAVLRKPLTTNYLNLFFMGGLAYNLTPNASK